MSANILLSKLDGVRKTGIDRWVAKCPSHDDRKASLAIRELPDGRILVHDFAGCDVEEVLSAVGLTFDALYPEHPLGHCKPERHPFLAADILRAVEFEALQVVCAASTMAKGEALPESERERLLKAAGRICAAVQASGYGVRYDA